MRTILCVGALLIAAVVSLVALCNNDTWGGRTSDIRPAISYCKANVSAVTGLQHWASHPTCEKRFYAKVNLSSGGVAQSCGNSNSAVHVVSGTPLQVYTLKTCDLLTRPCMKRVVALG